MLGIINRDKIMLNDEANNIRERMQAPFLLMVVH
jgi:uncharacterized protein YkuJ